MCFDTDMAVEFGEIANVKQMRAKDNIDGVQVTCIDLRSARLADKMDRRRGLYYTLEGDGNISGALTETLGRYEVDRSRVLLIGLGNPSYTADALGSSVLDRIEIIKDKVYKYYPLTVGTTGIESFDIIRAVAREVMPTLIITVDSLATVNPDRLGRSYQLTSAGIVPGSGVGAARRLIDSNTLGVDIIAIGVPFVCNMSKSGQRAGSSLIMTPSNIDSLIKACAKNISIGITDWLLQ